MRTLIKLLWVMSCCLFVSCSTQSSLAMTVEIQKRINFSSLITTIDGIPQTVRISRVSGDGTVAVGQFANTQHERRVFRYTPSGGIEDLGVLGENHMGIESLSISDDGLVIWGTFYVSSGDHRIFRYTKESGLEDLGALGRRSTHANATSSDGEFVVGSFISGDSPAHVFRYSKSKGFEAFGPMGAKYATARGISADGSLIVGNLHLASDASKDHAFRYSESEGLQDIGAVDAETAFATGISNDGSVIVGMYRGDFSLKNYTHYMRSFIYTKTDGMKLLGSMGGRSVGNVSISADGGKMSGSYMDSNDESYLFSAIVKRSGNSTQP